ncbi:MAG: hypothetical protein HQ521_08190 [Bacteroidetes bacterium]|nr:hypothetical protein [Bacteroidota bacterium]
MRLVEASKFLHSLIEETDKKSEIKLYEKFLNIIVELEKRDLNETELQSIEEELNKLKLDANTSIRKKYIRKILTAFTKYLKDKFSLIPEGYYTQLGLAIGLTFGVALGLSVGNSMEIDNGMTYGLIFGMIFGLAFGKQKDSAAEKQNRVLKNNSNKK